MTSGPAIPVPAIPASKLGARARNIHATALVIGERGVLILGESGTGKSTLALALLESAKARGQFAGLISDDRVLIEVRGGQVVARTHPAIAGEIEARGAGILAAPALAGAVIDAVVVLSPAPPRLPEEDATRLIENVALPCLSLAQDADLPGKAGIVWLWLAQQMQAGRI